MKDELGGTMKALTSIVAVLIIITAIVIAFPSSSATYLIGLTSTTTGSPSPTTVTNTPKWRFINAYLEGNYWNVYFHDISYTEDELRIWITQHLDIGSLTCWIVWKVQRQDGTIYSYPKAETAAGDQVWSILLFPKDLARFHGEGTHRFYAEFYADEDCTQLIGYTNKLVFTLKYY